MAVNIHRPFMNNTGLDTQNCLTKLLADMSPDSENETDMINHSMYCNDVSFKNLLNSSSSKISILN